MLVNVAFAAVDESWNAALPNVSPLVPVVPKIVKVAVPAFDVSLNSISP